MADSVYKLSGDDELQVIWAEGIPAGTIEPISNKLWLLTAFDWTAEEEVKWLGDDHEESIHEALRLLAVRGT